MARRDECISDEGPAQSGAKGDTVNLPPPDGQAPLVATIFSANFDQTPALASSAPRSSSVPSEYPRRISSASFLAENAAKSSASAIFSQSADSRATQRGSAAIGSLLVPVDRCHQSLVRERAADEERDGMFGDWWDSLDLGVANAVVAEARREEVEPLIERYEWLGNLPDNCSRYAKLTFDGNIAGAIAFSKSGFGGSFTLNGEPAIKLARGVSLHWSPPWASSFLIRRGTDILLRSDPLFVVAFSDWAAGEVGTVYQASGWRYLGHSPSSEWMSPDGERRDASFHKVRVVSGSRHRKTGRKASRDEYEAERAQMIEAGWTQVTSIRGKYATVAGRNGRERRRLLALLDGMARPYPKRAVGVNGELAEHSSSEGGVRSPGRAPTPVIERLTPTRM